MRAAYLFEAKGIQRYIFDSGRLRDVIGASEIVDSLARSDGKDLLRFVLDAGNFKNVTLSRRASAAFMAHGEAPDIARLRGLWRLALQIGAPGLEFADALVAEDADAFADLRLREKCQSMGSAVRENGIASVAPLANPFCAFVPRTGRAQTDFRTLGDGSSDPVDAIIAAQDAAYQRLRGSSDEGVAGRFLDETAKGQAPPYKFPRNLGDSETERDEPDNPTFPFKGARWVALVHADISGLGQIWIDLAIAAATLNAVDLNVFCDISKAIEEAVATAAQKATREVLLHAAEPQDYNGGKTEIRKVPARPLVLGGDDLSIIVRADLALNFTRRLLEEIETETASRFKALKANPHLKPLAGALPELLSACAGIAYAKANQPFGMAHALADSLCKYAKKAAKASDPPYPSALAFHAIGTSLKEDYDEEIVPVELTDRENRLLALQPLFVGGLVQAQPRLAALDNLVRALRTNERGRGKLLSMRAELSAGSQTAGRLWTRWREIFAKGAGETPGDLRAVDAALKALDVTEPTGLPFDGKSPRRTPIFDALELIDLRHAPLP